MWALWVVAISATLLVIYLALCYHRSQENLKTVERAVGTLQELEKSIQEKEDHIEALRNTWKDRADNEYSRFCYYLQRKEEEQEKLEKSSAQLATVTNELAASRAEDATLREGYNEKAKALEVAHNNRLVALQQAYSKMEDDLRRQYQEQEVLKKEEFDALMLEMVAAKEELENRVEEQRTILMVALEQNRLNNLNDAKSMLNVPEIDRIEVAELMDVCRHIRNRVPLCKAIYEIYYRTPYGTLVNDLGVRGVCGIYKITNKVDGKIYIGQSVDVGERWKQHLKRGCGAEVGTISGSKLYSAMMEHGLWNFKFELLQECKKDELSKYEKYWINYFNSVEYGYNMKAGG